MEKSATVDNPHFDASDNLDTEFGDPKLMGDGDEGSESVEQNVADLKRLLSEARQRLANIDKAVRHAV
jgi:hypothetical protein